jgi:hypothetical protein
MKNLFFIFILLSSSLYATIITVDNTSYSIGDYTNLQYAHDDAIDGDEIHVYPSILAYSSINVTKQLTFYGVGFDLDEFPNQPTLKTSSISGNMTFSNGSQGSFLEGFDGSFSITIETNNITIKRNKLHEVHITGNNLYGISILQNQIITDYRCIYATYSDTAEVYISNNILIETSDYSSTSSIKGALMLSVFNGYPDGSYSDHQFWTITNNIISVPQNSYISVINSQYDDYIIALNNIIIDGNIWIHHATNLIQYNISNEDQLPDGNGNIENIDMNTVFIDPDNYDFHLLSGSPAIGSGMNGIDMGIYGGQTPYIDSGMPGLPSIFYLDAPYIGSQQSGLDVIIKAKSNKE